MLLFLGRPVNLVFKNLWRPIMEEWICEKVMPCSCRNEKADREYGKHLRHFDQAWNREEKRHQFYEWECACGKRKPGKNE
jgi:hypothetical protein